MKTYTGTLEGAETRLRRIRGAFTALRQRRSYGNFGDSDNRRLDKYTQGLLGLIDSPLVTAAGMEPGSLNLRATGLVTSITNCEKPLHECSGILKFMKDAIIV